VLSLSKEQKLSFKKLIGIIKSIEVEMLTCVDSDSKILDFPPSRFVNGSKCGHSIKYRDVFYCPERKKYNFGFTIQPKVPPLEVKLKT
jgi:hypothetical protein